jgi:hypothetical protein
VAAQNSFFLLKGPDPKDCIKPSANEELLLAPFEVLTLESTKNTVAADYSLPYSNRDLQEPKIHISFKQLSFLKY